MTVNYHKNWVTLMKFSITFKKKKKVCIGCGKKCKKDFCSNSCREYYFWKARKNDFGIEEEPPLFPDGMSSTR